jgi:hypothetical protein
MSDNFVTNGSAKTVNQEKTAFFYSVFSFSNAITSSSVVWEKSW